MGDAGGKSDNKISKMKGVFENGNNNILRKSVTLKFVDGKSSDGQPTVKPIPRQPPPIKNVRPPPIANLAPQEEVRIEQLFPQDQEL